MKNPAIIDCGRPNGIVTSLERSQSNNTLCSYLINGYDDDLNFGDWMLRQALLAEFSNPTLCAPPHIFMIAIELLIEHAISHLG